MAQQISECDLIQSPIKSSTITTSTIFLKTGTIKYCPFISLHDQHKYEIRELEVFQNVML